MKYVLFFGEAGKHDVKEIGFKGANLARLSKKKYNVPPGFILSSKVFEVLLSNKDVKKSLHELFKCNDNELPEKCKEVKDLIKFFEFPEEIVDEMIEAYLSLSVDLSMSASSLLETKEVYVAVRGSYTEDKGSDSGLKQKTILNIKGKNRLFKGILDCYASNFNIDMIKYRKQNNYHDFSSAVIVQKMVNTEKSGVAYIEGDQITVTACFGLGEGLSSGKVFPDVYTVDKNKLSVINYEIAEKQYEYVRDIETDKTVQHRLGEKSLKQVLFDNEIIEISRILKKIIKELEKPLKIEWGIKNNIIYVLQAKDAESSKPETVEMEVFEETEDKPDIVDISDNDLDEDLQVLEEIEIYEQKTDEPVTNKEPEVVEPQSEPIVEQEPEPVDDPQPEYRVYPSVDEPEEHVPSPVKENNEIDLSTPTEPAKEEKPVDDSIFSNYDSFNVTDKPSPVSLNKSSELAKFNSGNVIVYCHMSIKEKLKQKLQKFVNEIPQDFEIILNELLEYEPVHNEDDLRHIHKVKHDFVKELKYPDPDDVALGLRLIENV